MNLRPKKHFTPVKGWMNDPNGLVYYKGKYHLFYQYNPYSCEWDHMHWGHAISDDLVNWEHLPIALVPDENGDIFSGSCVVDNENVSGFGAEDNPALIAFYTSHHTETKREEQCIAYSLDGVNFTKYDKNPIIAGSENTPARDPFVFENKVIGGYSMCFTIETSVLFYHSNNLIHWKKTGEFILPEWSFQGMIECPCLFENSGKYVLMMSMDIAESEYNKFSEDVMPHNRLMQYLVGDFDGYTFKVSQIDKGPLLVDNGSDFYAGTLFNNIDDIILMAWIGNSDTCLSIPTEEEGFKGALTYPQMLYLDKTDNGYRLHHQFYPQRENGSDTFINEYISSDGLTSITKCGQ